MEAREEIRGASRRSRFSPEAERSARERSHRRTTAFFLFLFAGIQASFFLFSFSRLVGHVAGDEFLAWIFLNLFLIGGEVWAALLLLGEDLTVLPFPLVVGFLAGLGLFFSPFLPFRDLFRLGSALFTMKPMEAIFSWGAGITLAAWLFTAPVLFILRLVLWQEEGRRRRRRRKVRHPSPREQGAESR